MYWVDVVNIDLRGVLIDPFLDDGLFFFSLSLPSC